MVVAEEATQALPPDDLAVVVGNGRDEPVPEALAALENGRVDVARGVLAELANPLADRSAE